jgi:hypothetical protein
MKADLRDKSTLNSLHREIQDKFSSLPPKTKPKRRKCATCGKIRPVHAVLGSARCYCSPACTNEYLRSKGFRSRL